jgi:outer membrane protein assembly factor BamB
VLAGSTDGYVYAINQKRGDVLWRFSSGEPISEAPIAIDDCVYAATDSDTLFCLEAETGEQRWQVPRVHRVITVSADRVYGLDVTARLVVLDRTTGVTSAG